MTQYLRGPEASAYLRDRHGISRAPATIISPLRFSTSDVVPRPLWRRSSPVPAHEDHDAIARAGAGPDIAEWRSSIDTTPRDMASGSRLRMRLIAFWPMIKGSLRGFATIELPIGLRIADCPVYAMQGKAWAALPAKPILDGEGRHVRSPGGKPQYAAILSWRDRDLADRWSATVVELIRAAHPDALDDIGRPQQ
jgi:hypothetical protein